jgi:hypothetical protein
MTLAAKPWARKAFELLFHAESHFRAGTDYDKRLALISFDNSIEVSISIYLALNPIQRGSRQYKKEDVKTWLTNYHTKLDFFSQEISQRGLPEYRGKAQIVWLHEQRNELYHGSSGGVPEIQTLEDIRGTAFWVFSILFEIADVDSKISSTLEVGDASEPVIPDNYAKPELVDLTVAILDPKRASALTIASLIGRWDESNPADMEIIRRLANEF